MYRRWIGQNVTDERVGEYLDGPQIFIAFQSSLYMHRSGKLFVFLFFLFDSRKTLCRVTAYSAPNLKKGGFGATDGLSNNRNETFSVFQITSFSLIL